MANTSKRRSRPLSPLPLLLAGALALGGCGTAQQGADTGNGGPQARGSRVTLKVAVPEPIATDFCARVSVSGGDFSPIVMDRVYPGGTTSVETVVPNIPAGADRMVELGLFRSGTCGEFAGADWYGQATGVPISAQEVTLVTIELRSFDLPGTGSVIVRSGVALLQRVLHGEVVAPDTTPIAAAACRVLQGTTVVGTTASGAAITDIGVLNTLVEVNTETTELLVECSHPLYRDASKVAVLVEDPADARYGTFAVTVEMTPSEASLPVFTVTGTALSRDTITGLAEAMGFNYDPADENGALRYVNADRFHALPLVPVDTSGEDEEGTTTRAEGFDFPAIAEMPVLAMGSAMETTQAALRAAGADPAQTGGAVVAGVAADHTLFQAFDVEGAELARKEVETRVRYDFTLGGVPLIGPGAKASFAYDGSGIPVQATYALRTVVEGETLPLIPIAVGLRRARAAFRALARQEGLIAVIQVTPPQVVYYAPPLSVQATALYPHYLFQGTVRVGDEDIILRNVLVPAVAGAPEIGMNVSYDGGVITAEASVTGGTPPYTYHWSSSTTELDPATAGASPPISYDLNPKAPAAQEIVSLVVTDADGLVAWASASTPLPQPAATRPSARYLPVGGVVDFGAEWIGTCAGLPGSSGNAGGFVSTMSGEGYVKRFNWGQNNAWEQDFKDPSFSGGDDANWVDNADFVFYTGHANGNGFTFCNSSHTDNVLTYRDALWGNVDMEWLTIAACGPLQDTSGGLRWWQRWGPAFDGLHLLLAYANSSLDNTTEGRRLAQYMIGRRIFFVTLPPVPVRSAWILTAREVQLSRVTWAVMGVIGPSGLSNYNDYFHGKGPVGPDIRGTSIHGYWKLSGPS